MKGSLNLNFNSIIEIKKMYRNEKIHFNFFMNFAEIKSQKRIHTSSARTLHTHTLETYTHTHTHRPTSTRHKGNLLDKFSLKYVQHILLFCFFSLSNDLCDIFFSRTNFFCSPFFFDSPFSIFSTLEIFNNFHNYSRLPFFHQAYFNYVLLYFSCYPHTIPRCFHTILYFDFDDDYFFSVDTNPAWQKMLFICTLINKYFIITFINIFATFHTFSFE